jgi:branched-chain amino acid aminotransferase
MLICFFYQEVYRQLFIMSYVLINGKYVKDDQAKISIKDRGLRFGDGLFETIKVENAKMKDFSLHYHRLSRGLQAIMLKIDLAEIEKNAALLITKNNLTEGIIRIMITRGEGSMGYLPAKNIKPNLIIEALKLPDMLKKEYKLLISNYIKMPLNALPVQYKLMQGLNSTLAKIVAKKYDYDDALMLNNKGQICETASANIFLLKKGKIYTPSLESPALQGIVREKIITAFSVIEKKIKIKKISKFDLIFITNVSLPLRLVKEIYDEKQNLVWSARNVENSIKLLSKIERFIA